MSNLHAWYCAGTFFGALFGSVMAALSIAPLFHFAAIAALLAWPLWIGYRALPNDEPEPDAITKIFALPQGALVTLGVIGFCGAIAEGSIADWSGIFLRDHLDASEGLAPLGYTAFTATMLAARLMADRLKDRCGARKVVASGALLSAFGVFMAVLVSNCRSLRYTENGYSPAGLGAKRSNSELLRVFATTSCGMNSHSNGAGLLQLDTSAERAGSHCGICLFGHWFGCYHAIRF